MKTGMKGDKKSTNKEEEASAASETAATSTALVPATAASLASSAASQHQMEVDQRRETLQHQMILLSVMTTATMAVFVMTIVPFTILIAFGMFATSAGLLSFTTFQRLLLEYQEIVAGDGFAQFLPQEMMQHLTQTTLHQFLRDDTFVREWGFLALYFVPGLTEDQLNDYIRRLAPDRQVFLNRRGMGHFLGDNFMRIMVGERRWRQEAIVANVPIIETNPQVVVVRSRGLDFDSDAESNASAPVGLTVPATQPADNGRNPQVDQEERRRQLALEGDVIMTALYDGICSYVNMGMIEASAFARQQMLGPIGELATYAGLASSIGVTFLSVGTGIWRYSSRPTSSMGQASPPPPAFSALLLSTTMLGGLSTGVMLYARSALQVARSTKRKPPPK